MAWCALAGHPSPERLPCARPVTLIRPSELAPAPPRRAASARRVAFLLRGGAFFLAHALTRCPRERPSDVDLADAVRLSRLPPVAGCAGAHLRSASCYCSLQCCRRSSEASRDDGRSLRVMPSSTSGGGAAGCLRWRQLCLTTSAAAAYGPDRRLSCCCSPQRSSSQREGSAGRHDKICMCDTEMCMCVVVEAQRSSPAVGSRCEGRRRAPRYEPYVWSVSDGWREGIGNCFEAGLFFRWQQQGIIRRNVQ